MTSHCHYCHSQSLCRSSPTHSPQLANFKLGQLHNALVQSEEKCRLQKELLLRALKHLEAKRELLSRLCASKDSVRRAQERKNYLIKRLHESRSKVSVAEARLSRKKSDVAKLPEYSNALEKAGEETRRDLGNRKKAHTMALKSLMSRQAMEIDALYQVLPVRVSGVKLSTGQPMQVSIANMRLPEVASKVAAYLQADCTRTSAALGYLILHLDLLCSILDAPLLHESHYLGANSSVWQAPDFWRRTTDTSNNLLLSGLPSDSLTNSFVSGAHAWASIALEPAESTMQEAGVMAGVRLLLRSAACACQHHLARNRPLPMHWSPFAWLVLVAESIDGRRCHLGGVWGLAASEDGPEVRDVHECFTDFEQDDSEWNLIQARSEVLPPPPSEEVDTEHWERAMFRDRQEGMSFPRGRRITDTVSLWVAGRK